MYLFVDGARMGYGLGAAENDLTLADFGRLADASISAVPSAAPSSAKRRPDPARYGPPLQGSYETVRRRPGQGGF